LGGLCCLGIFAGVTAAQPQLFAWTALILAVFAAFNILLVRAVFAWIDRWLSQRKTREILGAIFMLLALSVQLINPALHQSRPKGQTQKAQKQAIYRNLMASPWLKTAIEVQTFLPPGLAAGALRQAAEQQPPLALEALGTLGLFVVGAGSALGLRLRAEYRGENLGAAPARKKAAKNSARAIPVSHKAAVFEAESGMGSSGPIAAIMEKEFRTLLRTPFRCSMP
jgi:ABC-2 type transport system permease protein